MFDFNPFREYKEMMKKRRLVAEEDHNMGFGAGAEADYESKMEHEKALKAADDELDVIADDEAFHEIPGFVKRHHGVLHGKHIEDIIDMIHNSATAHGDEEAAKGYEHHHDAAFKAIRSHPAWEPEVHGKIADKKLWSPIEAGSIKDEHDLSGLSRDEDGNPRYQEN